MYSYILYILYSFIYMYTNSIFYIDIYINEYNIYSIYEYIYILYIVCI